MSSLEPSELRRAVGTAAAAAASEHEFFARLDAAGISVRRRYSTRDPGEVTGYAVALPVDTSQTGGPVWYSGGKLTPDLTLPKLRHRWAPGDAASRGPFTAAEQDAISPAPLFDELLASHRRHQADAGPAIGTVRHLATRTTPGRQGEVDLPNSSKQPDSPTPIHGIGPVLESLTWAYSWWAILGSNQ